jgi:hypothetical protein
MEIRTAQPRLDTRDSSTPVHLLVAMGLVLQYTIKCYKTIMEIRWKSIDAQK